MTTKPQKIEGGWKQDFDNKFDNMTFAVIGMDGIEPDRQRVKSFISDLLASEHQRCVEEMDFEMLFLEWREYVDGAYKLSNKFKGRKVILSFPVWLNHRKFGPHNLEQMK